jgi:hypothetical protein
MEETSMAKNESREFATMDEEQRKKFELDAGAEGADHKEMDFEEPRDADRMGRHSMNPVTEKRGDRDGDAANLDDAAHDRRVAEVERGAERARKAGKGRPDGER